MSDNKLFVMLGIGFFFLITITLLMCVTGCQKMPFDYINDFFCLTPDNQIEQAVESVIEHETGIEFDLSKENNG